jgi:hypothetical protein
MAKPFCMVCCAKAAKGEISHHEIRKAKVQFRMYQSGETAYLCNQCSKDNFEIDPGTPPKPGGVFFRCSDRCAHIHPRSRTRQRERCRCEGEPRFGCLTQLLPSCSGASKAKPRQRWGNWGRGLRTLESNPHHQLTEDRGRGCEHLGGLFGTARGPRRARKGIRTRVRQFNATGFDPFRAGALCPKNPESPRHRAPRLGADTPPCVDPCSCPQILHRDPVDPLVARVLR